MRAAENDTTILPQKPVILVEIGLKKITKTDGINLDYSDANDTLTFDVTITNTGNTRLHEVELTNDSIACDHDLSGMASGLLPLNPNGGLSCEASTRLASVDVDTGYIIGMAEASWSTVTLLHERTPPPTS